MSASLLKTQWEKEKLLVTSNFSFSHSAFYPFGELSAIFMKFGIVASILFSVWKSLKFVVNKTPSNVIWPIRVCVRVIVDNQIKQDEG